MKEYENRYKQLLNQMLDGYALHEIICDDKGIPIDYRFLEVNPVFEKMTGLNAESIIGCTCLEVLPNTELSWIERYGKVAMTGEPAYFEDFSQELNRYFEVTAFCTAQNQFACTFNDITERKKEEEKLKESEEKFRVVFENSPVGKSITGIDGSLHVNQSFCDIVGYTEDELRKKTWMEISHPDEIQQILDITESILSGEISQAKFEKRYIHKNGSIIFTDTSTYLQRNTNGEPQFFITSISDITERKQAEIILHNTNARHAAMIENIGDVISIVTPDGFIIYQSPNIEKWFGWKPEDIIDTNGWRNVHPEDIERVQKALSEVLQTEEVLSVEYRFKCKDGNYKWIDVTGVNRINDPAINGILINYHDITERKVSEERLKESDERFNLAMSASKDGLFDWNLITNKIYYSPGWKRMLGYDDKELANDFSIWEKLIEPKDAETSWKMQQELLNKERDRFELEFKMRHKDGHWIDILSRAKAIFDGTGEAIRIVGTHVDITYRKQAELALAAEKERLAVTLRSIGDGVITTDINGNIVMLNKVAEELTGWTLDEASGHPLPVVFNIINENTRKKCQNPVERVLLTGKVIELENHTCLIAKDGREIVIADSGAPIHDKNSKIIGVVLVFRDMTEKQKLEDSMYRAHKLESLGILAGGIAHDFNNLLSGIFGYTEMALAKTTEEKVTSYLSESLSNIERARGLTQQLLTFAKGGKPIKRVEKLFPFVKETVQFALSGSSVSSKFEIQNDLWVCDFDKNQIGQVIDNLIINAIQAMPNGGIIEVIAQNISLSKEEHTTLIPGNYVKLSIKDQGIGIPKEFLPRIFDPYYTTKPKGHGLGLATCYSIIKRHDGIIDVESKSGKGSTFHIYLPASSEIILSEVKKGLEKHKGTGTFLVMDDDKVICELMKEMIGTFGYTVVLKNNGEDTIDFFKAEIKANRKVAGMIFDLTIPGGMGGKETIKEIRKLCTDTPVFVASGYSSDPIIANPEEYGFNASISKPFMLKELSEMLEKHIKI